MAMARDLQNKVIIITGASAGIGAATALACAKAGMRITLAARRRDKLEAVARQIEQDATASTAAVSTTPRTLIVPCDVDKDEDVQALFARSWETFGRCDVIFANAGYGQYANIMDMSDADHRAMFETNYWGTVRTIRFGVPDLRRTKDGLKHVLICTSSASEISLPTFGVYCATKAAQDGIVGALRGELGVEGISVTGVHPVGTNTEFFDTAAQRSDKETAASGDMRVNTPKAFRQSSERVARCIVKAIRRPRAEVWPMPLARYALAFATACPSLTAWMTKRHYRKRVKQ